MRKLISMLVAVVMAFSALGSVTAFATDSGYITDATNSAAVVFKAYLEDNGLSFDSNYFFIGDYEHDSDREVPYPLALKITSTSDATIGIGVYDADKGTMTGVPYYDCDALAEKYQSKVELTKDSATIIAMNNMGYDKFTPSKIGVALQNASNLAENTTIVVELVQVEEEEIIDYENETITINVTEIKDGKVDEIFKEFKVPVKFSDGSDLDSVASALTSIDAGKDIEYVVAVEALKELAGEISDDDKELLGEKLTTEVLEALTAVIMEKNTVTTSEGVVELPYLALSKAPAESNSTYKLVVKEAEAPVVDNYATVAYDITIKVDDKEVSSPAVKQKVMITIPSGWDYTKDIYYQHEGDESWTLAEIEEGKIVFYADAFSVFTLKGETNIADSTAENNKATKVTYKLVQDTENKNKFRIDIVPTYPDGSQIFKFATAAIKVQFSTEGIADDGMKNFSYELAKVGGVRLDQIKDVSVDDNNYVGGFSFIASAIDGENLITGNPGEAITVAELTVTGNGKFKAMSVSAENDNKMYTESLNNNIAIPVDVSENYWNEGVVYDIPELKYEITINMDFANRIEKSEADYLGMTITIGDTVVKVGSDDMPVEITDAKVSATSKAIKLSANETYSFEVEGKGFRTYRDSVYLDSNKTINLWNNAIDDGRKVNVIADNDETAKVITFLVGDIYMDGKVDVYDLNAVTSYYKPDRAITTENYDKYIAYDLNRDGKISLTDIAYVQVSYGN